MHLNNPSNQTKLGNVVDMPDSLGAAPRTILDLNLNDYQPEKVLSPGPWVITLQTAVLASGDGPAAGFNPLLARVRYGSGGSAAQADISAAPGTTFQLSADWVRVDLLLERRTEFFVLVPPELQRVQGFLRRGTVTTIPVRSFFFGANLLAPFLPAAVVTDNVPPFAKDVFLLSGNISQVWDAGIILRFLTGGVGAATLCSYTGAQLFAARNSGSALPVPAGAEVWELINGTAANVENNFTLEFGLDL